MNTFILKKAKKDIYEHSFDDPTIMIEVARESLEDIDEKIDKIAYLQHILENNEMKLQEHLKVCKGGEECDTNYAHNKVTYYLSQELTRLDAVPTDAFSADDKERAETQLKDIQEQLSKLMAGQEVLFNELDEMKQYFFLGKKKWTQLLMGKLTEMVVGGIVAEYSAKPLLEAVKATF